MCVCECVCVCVCRSLTGERVYGIKLEAEAISRQLECGDANLWEEVVELLRNLWTQSNTMTY